MKVILNYPDRTVTLDATGVGSAIKRMLARFGFHDASNCGCNAYAMTLDANGLQWCQEHKQEIVDRLEREAKKHGIPFARFAAAAIVNMAIKTTLRKQRQLK